MGIDTTNYSQPTGGDTLPSSGKRTRTLVRKGLYASILSEAEGRPRGTLIPDVGYVLSWQISRLVGDLAMVTYTCAVVTSEQWTSNEALTDTWSLKYMRMEIPIERYGGPSEVNNADLYDLAQWQTEPDKALYTNYQYRQSDQTIVDLSSFTIKLANKIKLGYQVVVRHSPIVTRTRIYAKKPTGSIGSDIDYIDTPDEYASAAAEWLKMQDDITQGADGNYTRVEAWQGAEYWDLNFYGGGSNRWEFGTI